jgi:hypothetical protein
MTKEELVITLHLPSECSSHDLNCFRQMVIEAGEVQQTGLSGRIEKARILAFLRASETIVAVGALKKPTLGYSRGVFKNACAKAAADEFGLELGWVVVGVAHRGHSYSRRIVEALVAYADGRKIYATSVTTRIAMHAGLTGCNFERDGVEWQSKRRPDEHLLLFVYNGHFS